MFGSIKLFDEQKGVINRYAEVCFTESDGRQKYVRRDKDYDETFLQVCKALIESRHSNHAAITKLNFKRESLYIAAKCIMVRKESGISKENLFTLADTIEEHELENKSDEIIWKVCQQIKVRPSTAASSYGTANPMGYTQLKNPDDDDSCCAIM